MSLNKFLLVIKKILLDKKNIEKFNMKYLIASPTNRSHKSNG